MRYFSRLMLFAVLAAALFLLSLPSELGSALTISPDSSEYAISLSNLFEHGIFGFTLNGNWFPSRYAPWFSLTCLSPAYFLSGGNTLCCHWAILAFSLLVLWLMYGYGRSVGLSGWSYALPVLLLLLPDYVFYSRVVMTEVPYVAIFLLASVMFVRFVVRDEITLTDSFLAGVVLTWCGMVRSTGLPMVLPFAVIMFLKRESWSGLFKRLLLLGVPVALYLIANCFYNNAVFGSSFRNGYHFWVPVPYDFKELLFSFSYVIPALKYYSQHLIVQVTAVFFAGAAAFAGAVVSGRFGGVAKNKTFLACWCFGGFQLAVLVVLYSGYYWLDTRFFLVAAIYFLPLFMYSVYACLNRFMGGRSAFVFPMVLIVCAVVFLMCPARYVGMTVGRPIWLAEARLSAEVLPRGSAVIQNGDPNVMDHFGFREKGLRLLPLARRFDYVKFMVAPESIGGYPCPEWNRDDWKRTLYPEFVDNGACYLPFRYTYFENPDIIHSMMASGARVFYLKDSWFEEELLDDFDATLVMRGMKRKLVESKSIEPIPSNPLRHWYDELLFPGYFMDSRPEIGVELYEIVPVDR